MSTLLIEEVYDFWFSNIENSHSYAQDRSKLWFAKHQEIDDHIKKQFLPAVEATAQGAYKDMCQNEQGLITCAILLDQFSRNIFRNHADMYQYDPLILSIAKEAIKENRDKKLSFFEKLFLYLPFEHSEDLGDQEKSLELFKAMSQDCTHELKDVAHDYFLYAQKHYDVIKRFSRFPHRNALLGRPSSPEELEYLAKGGGF